MMTRMIVSIQGQRGKKSTASLEGSREKEKRRVEGEEMGELLLLLVEMV